VGVTFPQSSFVHDAIGGEGRNAMPPFLYLLGEKREEKKKKAPFWFIINSSAAKSEEGKGGGEICGPELLISCFCFARITERGGRGERGGGERK